MTTEPTVAAVRDFHDMTLDERGAALHRAMWPARDVAARSSGALTIGKTNLYLDEADPASAAEIAQSVERFYQDFPHVAAHLQKVNVLDLPSGCYAGTADWHDGTFDISLNRIAYGRGRRSFLLDKMADDYHSGFHRFLHPAGTFEHELGHVLDGCTSGIGPAMLSYWDAHDISGYAVHGGPAEAFADAFANWREGVRNSAHVDDVMATVARAAQQAVAA